MTVSDASPLVGLSRVGQLELLPGLYRRIVIPPAAHGEVIGLGVSPTILGRAGWLTVESPRDTSMVDQLRHVEGLDSGESEAIVLALERGMRLVLDERRGLHVAQAHGLLVFGTVHVIVEAALAGLISADDVESLLRGMRQADFWVSERLIRQAVTRARGDV